MDKLVAGFEAKTGTHVKVTYGSGLSTRKTVASGQALDVSVLFAPFQEALATGQHRSHKRNGNRETPVGGGGAKGRAEAGHLRQPAAVKKTLLNAKSIVAVDPAGGSAGAITLAALDKLGITDQLKPKIKWVQGANQVQESVAKGETEIALGPYLSEMHNPGIDAIGALPAEVSTPVITGFLSTNVKDPKAANALLDYLSSH